MCSLAVPYVSAQNVLILDEASRQPIEDVLVYNLEKTKSVISNSAGQADLTIFSDNDILTFQHPGYYEFTITKKSLSEPQITLEERVIQIKNIVVSANKWEQDASEIPNQIISISSKEVAFNNPQTSADLLANTGEVYVQKSQLGGGSPKLRGFAANSVLLVVDGVRMNNAIYRSGNLQNVISIDPNALSGAEVILGPSSVIYGSDALGGVMDFHIKEAKYALDDKPRTFGTAISRYSSANREKTAHVDFGVGFKKVSSFTSLSFSNFGDLKGGRNRPIEYPEIGKRTFVVAQNSMGEDMILENDDINLQTPSGFNGLNIVQKVGFRPSSKIDLDYGFYFSNTSDVPRYDRLIQVAEDGAPSNAEWFYGPQKWAMHRVKAALTAPSGLFDQARMIIAYQNYKESRNDRKFMDNRLRTRTEKVDIWSFNLDFDKKMGKSDFFYGAELLHNDITSSGERKNTFTGEITPTTPRYPDGGSSYTSLALYGSYTTKLTSHLIVNTGLRYSQINIQAKTKDVDASLLGNESLDLNNGALNGSIGLVMNKGANKFSGLLSTGFRAPNIDDIGKIFELDDAIVIVPNANLKPEYSYNSELNWQFQNSRIRTEATVFYTFLNNAIVRSDFAVNGLDSLLVDGSYRSIRSQVNAEQASIYGGSLAFMYTFHNHFAVKGSITYTDGKEKESGQPLRHTTPLFGSVRAVYKKNKLRGEFYIEFNGNRLRDDIPSTEIDDKPHLYAVHSVNFRKDGSPAWATLNLKASYQISKVLTVNGGIENITDLHYRPYSSGISAPGRNLILAIRANF